MDNRKNIFIVIVVLSCFSFLYLSYQSYEMSNYMLKAIKESIVPEMSDNKIKNAVKGEIVPILYLDENQVCDERDLSYDDFLEYAAGFDNNVMATGSDADSVIVEKVNLESADLYSDDKSSSNVGNNESNNGEEVATSVAVINGGNGITYSMDDLMDYDFLVTNCYAVDSSTSVNPEELDVNNLLSKDLTIDTSGDDYKVLIYHTHGSEEFSDSREGIIEDTVIGVGDELTRILEEDYGIKTYHDRTVYDVIDGELDRSYAYDMASEGVDKILEEYPSIEVVLDIHRDGVRDDVYLVRNIDGRPTAQIMFLNGVSRSNTTGEIDYLYNPNKIDNLSFSLQMHLIGKQMYGDLMRRIYIRGYCYNLDKKPRASLIEVGAQTNTVEEAKNAMIPLGAILYRVLTEK